MFPERAVRMAVYRGGRVSGVGILLLGSAVGFAGSTFGSMAVDHVAMRRKTRAEIAVEILPRLRAWPPSQRSEPIGRLTILSWLLSDRERRCIHRLDRAWFDIQEGQPWIV